jgi:hypothetical protein
MTAHSWSIPDMILRYTDEFGFRPDPMAHPMTPIIQVRRLLLLFPRTINNNNNKILRRRAIQSDSRRLTGILRRLSPVSVVLHNTFRIYLLIQKQEITPKLALILWW